MAYTEAMARESFRQKAVIVTGASSGIGRALAHALAKEGAHLALAARDAKRLKEVALHCTECGGKALVCPTDVADEGQCRDLVARCSETYGRIDMIVNNAGIDQVALLADLPDLDLFRRVVDVNFYGTVFCTYFGLPHLRETRGRIVNISSLGGILAVPYNTSYVASKFAVNGFSDSLRMEVAPSGVSVTVICPYWVVTEFHERYLDRNGMPKGPSGRKAYTRGTMSAERCAAITVEAARSRKREVVLGPGRLGRLMKAIAPAAVDRATLERFMRPLAERMSSDDES
jgi:short-subunit dehydrogenase